MADEQQHDDAQQDGESVGTANEWIDDVSVVCSVLGAQLALGSQMGRISDQDTQRFLEATSRLLAMAGIAVETAPPPSIITPGNAN